MSRHELDLMPVTIRLQDGTDLSIKVGALANFKEVKGVLLRKLRTAFATPGSSYSSPKLSTTYLLHEDEITKQYAIFTVTHEDGKDPMGSLESWSLKAITDFDQKLLLFPLRRFGLF